MEQRLATVEKDVSDLTARVSLVERDLKHGDKTFNRLEVAIDKLENIFSKVTLWIIGGLCTSVVLLLGYIWTTQVG